MRVGARRGLSDKRLGVAAATTYKKKKLSYVTIDIGEGKKLRTQSDAEISVLPYRNTRAILMMVLLP